MTADQFAHAVMNDFQKVIGTWLERFVLAARNEALATVMKELRANDMHEAADLVEKLKDEGPKP